MSTVRPMSTPTPATQAEGLLTFFKEFTERLRAVVQYTGSIQIPGGIEYSMGYVDDGMRGGQAASILVRTTPEGSAILETPVPTSQESEGYYYPPTPSLADVTAYINDAPAIAVAVQAAVGNDAVLAAALRQSPLTVPRAPGRGGLTLA